MAVNNNFVGGYNPYTQGLASSQGLVSQVPAPAPSMSLLEQKLAEISAKNEEKSVVTGLAGTNLPNFNENLLDVAQSSIYQAGSHLYDIVSDQNRTNQEILELSDAKAGLSAQGRERMVSAPQQLVADELGQGNYWEAAKKLPGAALGTIADSAGSVAEIGGTAAALAVGTAAAPAIAGAVGLAALGKKLYSGVKVADKVVDAVDTAKKAGIVAKTANVTKAALKAAPKAAAQVSVATADMTQRQVNTYQENFGEAPSTERVIGMYASNLGTMIFQPGIVKGLFVPAFKKQIKGEIKDIAKNLVKGSNMVKLGSRVGSGIVKVGAAGLAEGTQEYMQSWVEVLNTQLGPEDTGKFIEAVSREIGDKDNQLQALLGGYLGTAAGAGIRSATTVPAVATGGALDLTKATAKGTVGVTKAVVGKGLAMGADMSARAGAKILTPENRAELREEKARDKRIGDQKIAGFQTQIDSIEKATTVEEFMSDDYVNEKLAESGEWTVEELRDPKVLEKAKRSIIAGLKKNQSTIKGTIEKDSYAKALGNIKENTVEIASSGVTAVTEAAKAVVKATNTEKLVAMVEGIGVASVKAVKEMETGAARGVLNLALTGSASSAKNVIESAKNLEVADIDRIVTVLSEKEQTKGTVKLVKDLKNLAVNKVRALKEASKDKGTLTTLSNILPDIANIASSTGITADQSDSVLHTLSTALKSKIGDVDTLEVVEAAVAKYKESASSKGAGNKVTVAALDKRLAAQSKRIRQPLRTAAKKAIATAMESVTSVGVLPYLKDTPAVSAISDLLETNPTLQEFKEKASKIIAAAPKLEDMPDMSTEEGAAQVNASLTKAYESAGKTIADASNTLQELALGKTAVAANKAKAAEKTTKEEEASSTLDKEKQSKTLANLEEHMASVESSISSTDNAKLSEVMVTEEFPAAAMAIFVKAGVTTKAEAVALVSKYPTLSKSATMAAAIDKAFPEAKTESVVTEDALDTDEDTEYLSGETEMDVVSEMVLTDEESDAIYLKENKFCTL